jgi:hypothetical protein
MSEYHIKTLEEIRVRINTDEEVTVSVNGTIQYTMPLEIAKAFAENLTQLVEHQNESSNVSGADWTAFEALYGAWVELDIPDDWVDNLRDEWEERFKDIYGTE